MGTAVMDSWALMALLNDEPEAPEVERLLAKAAEKEQKFLLCAVNWGEIYYSVARAEGEAAADRQAGLLTQLPIEIVGVAADLQLVREAARLKAAHPMSYADCFAAALAKVTDAELVTGDPEFKRVSKEIRIHWLR